MTDTELALLIEQHIPSRTELAAYFGVTLAQVVPLTGGVFKIVDDLEYPAYWYSYPTCPWPGLEGTAE